MLDIIYAQVDWLGRPRQVVRKGQGFPDSNEAYDYDLLGRLTRAAITPPLDGYDEYQYRYLGPDTAPLPTLGNRTQRKRFNAGALRSVDAYALGTNSMIVNTDGGPVGKVGDDDRLLLVRNQDLSSGTVTSSCNTYDEAGNLLAQGSGTDSLNPTTACASPLPGKCFTYDDWARLASAGTGTSASCQTYWQYRYDWKGRRVSVVGQGAFGSKTYDFYYDLTDRLLTEVAFPSNTPENNYYYLGEELIAQEHLGTGAVFYVHNDHLGTPQRMTGADRAIKWGASLSPFGETGTANVFITEMPIRFPGQYDDRRKGTGFAYYNYHRYYQPETGRYMQVEPVVRPTAAPGVYPTGYTGEPGYAYARSSSLAASDPTGLVTIVGCGELQERVDNELMRFYEARKRCLNCDEEKKLDDPTLLSRLIILCRAEVMGVIEEGKKRTLCGGWGYPAWPPGRNIISLYKSAFIPHPSCICLAGVIGHEISHALGERSKNGIHPPRPDEIKKCVCRYM